MIAMWDESFGEQDPEIPAALLQGRAGEAFERMHAILDRVWFSCARVLRPGGLACINIGDATRTIGEDFRLYTNHSRVTATFESVGLSSLPPVIWRKSTNAPNKFMGSGMFPAGAYVTLEHEYLLVFRKGRKRTFSGSDLGRRRRSAYFWEERNSWFSDLWQLNGTRQLTAGGSVRARSGAFPLEIALRLVLMYSAEGDIVLDPFTGTGTTQFAALSTGRSSIGIDRDPGILEAARRTLRSAASTANAVTERRIAAHRAFEIETERAGKPLGYWNEHHGFRVKTRQETAIALRTVTSIREDGGVVYACY